VPQLGDDGKQDPDPAVKSQMREWQDVTQVKVDGNRVKSLPDGRLQISFPVRLPSRANKGPLNSPHMPLMSIA
jgi:hypothetical protein